MKKVIVIAIAVLLVLGTICLTACNGGNNNFDYTTFTVTFDSQGGSEIASQSVYTGNVVRNPGAPTKDGYNFVGWYKSADENADEWKFTTDAVTSDITLYAHWMAETVIEPTASLTYERNETGYTVTGSTGQEEVIIIPDTYEGLPVTVIGESAFAYSKHTADITSVTIPDSVTLIEKNAFYARSELAEVKIGVNSGLKEIQNNAFSGCGALKEIYLPKTLEKLGGGTTNPAMEDPVPVFNNCGSIERFIVASDNPNYMSENGHLIEKVTGRLLRGSNNATIPSSVKEIAQTAFRRSTLTSLYIPVSVEKIGNYIIQQTEIASIQYAGTEEQWNAIEKTKYWNMGKTDVVIEYGVETPTPTKTEEPTEEVKVLIAYFSRADENYNVGTISKGNTEIVAEMIQDKVGGTLFHIERATDYPAKYSDCLTETTAEKNANARPALKADVNVEEYDIIFIGYPIWWSDLPMPVYTFLENHDWSGKTVIPFNTHEGSGQSGTQSTIRNKCAGATVLNGLAIQGKIAQNSRDSARASVNSWIDGLNLSLSE